MQQHNSHRYTFPKPFLTTFARAKFAQFTCKKRYALSQSIPSVINNSLFFIRILKSLLSKCYTLFENFFLNQSFTLARISGEGGLLASGQHCRPTLLLNLRGLWHSPYTYLMFIFVRQSGHHPNCHFVGWHCCSVAYKLNLSYHHRQTSDLK